MRLLVISAVSLVLLGIAGRAAAGGLEYPGAGSQALGRAGAVVARAEDPMVLANNPAGLAELRGNQMMLDLNIAFMKACVDPVGYYGWGVYSGGTPSRIPNPSGGDPLVLNLGTGMPGTADAYYTGQLDTVCMKQALQPIPELGFTARVSKDLGIGIGLMFPAATPNGKWGDDNGVIVGAAGLRPAATRYMQISSGLLGLFPTAGFGYRITDWLRIGAAFEWGIINVDNRQMSVVAPGTTPAQDVIAHVKGTDWFVPAFNASVHLVPIDSLDIVAMFRYQDALNAPGTIDLTTGVFDVRARPRTKRDVVDGIHFTLPWKVTGAIRYAKRLAPRPSGSGQGEATRVGVNDAFRNELWDIELDAEYLLSARNKELRVDYQENQAIEAENLAGMVTMARFPDVSRPNITNTDTVIPKYWNNQLSLRLGGSYNVLPGLFGFSLGAHYETMGVNPDYMQIDFWPVSRIGLHAGIKVRVSGRIDLTASFAHIFQETVVVAAPQDEPRETSYPKFMATGEVTTIDKRVGVAARGAELPVLNEPAYKETPNGTARIAQYVTKSVQGQTPWIINSGTYRSSLNVVAVGLNVHF